MGVWIGLVLLATVTSLPELATGVSSVTLADAPDVALGNVLGACVLTLAIVMLALVALGLAFSHLPMSIRSTISRRSAMSPTRPC